MESKLSRLAGLEDISTVFGVAVELSECTERVQTQGIQNNKQGWRP
jgi:hypothetical protein